MRNRDDELERMAAALRASGEYKVLKRFVPRHAYSERRRNADVRRGLYVDVETTGLDPSRDRIIEFAAIPFTYDADSAEIIDVETPYSALEDPGERLPQVIARLTGISDQELKDRSIDDAAVLQLIADSDLVVAHNAAFDKPFLQRRLPAFGRVLWGCSLVDIDWQALGCRSTRLEYLLEYFCGEFSEGHRAVADCAVALHILAKARLGNESVLRQILSRTQTPHERVWVLNVAYADREVFKRRGYRFTRTGYQAQRSWYIDLLHHGTDAELKWIEMQALSSTVRVFCEPLSAFARFSVNER